MTKEDFTPEYWKALWGCYANGGLRDVAAYLATLDISKFDPKAPPPKTQAFWDIVMHNQPPEDAEMADAIDALKHNDAITIPSPSGLTTAKIGVPFRTAWKNAATSWFATREPMMDSG